MLHKPTIDVQEPESEDARVERSGRALRAAMRELLYEQAFDSITVLQIVQRAGVSRGTFYARYRNKEDALTSSFEGMFGAFEHQLHANPRDRRLVPVAELLTHFAEARPVMASLETSGRLTQIWELGGDFIADLIVRRMPATGARASLPPQLAARMLAGALMEMIRWWLDHPDRSTPDALDREFHVMAERLLTSAR